MATNEIFVYAHWSEEPILMGILQVDLLRGKEVYAFQFDKVWLTQKYNFYLDPDLQLYPGFQYPKEKANFGIFLDSAPDRWGRILMQRREAYQARLEQRKPRTLQDSDYLLGVHDSFRMGALRFKTGKINGVFENSQDELAAPPFARLRELEHASLQFENEVVNDENMRKWLHILLAPGSSLGGARPKANVADEKQNLWIAKFPAKNDTFNVGAWEMTAHTLAKMSGIETCEIQALKLNSDYHTFLIQRFDRKGNEKRNHFASAMALLGFVDGQEGASYLHLAEFIQRYGSHTKTDLAELWKRIVFNICIKNTDDHLRNHGFLLTDKGWKLSPVYDLNPVPSSTGLSLNINEIDNRLDLELALEVTPIFGINLLQAKQIITEVKLATSKWQTIAKNQGISRNEMERMEAAFI